MPSNSNIFPKVFETLGKYKGLKTIPVIVGVLGMIKKGTQKCFNEITGNLSLAEI